MNGNVKKELKKLLPKLKNARVLKKENKKWLPWVLLVVIVLLVIAFFPILENELRYLIVDKKADVTINIQGKGANQLSKETDQSKEKITPADNNFSIIIPKLDINSKVIKNVNPLEKDVYLQMLKDGVAHSKTSGLPSDKKQTFIFAHSSSNFYEPSGSNSIFYLLYKLKKDDVFYLVYENKVYKYIVQELKKVDKDRVEYLYSAKDDSSAVLMTCWPPGTISRRLLVFGKLISIE